MPIAGLQLREGERLLASLILAGQPVTALELAKRFYPSEAEMNPQGQGDFACVRQALSSLRKALGDDATRLVRVGKATVQFDLTGLDCDLTAFDKLAHTEGDHAPQAWEQAAALYSAPLLDGWNENWVKEHRTRRKRTYDRLLRDLIQHAQQHNDTQSAGRWLRKLLESCPEDEDAQHELRRLTEIRPYCSASPAPPTPTPRTDFTLEPAGGAMSLRSPFYVVRDTDTLFHAALERRDSIVLVNGARQVGKTSLLARGLQAAREAGARVVLTDFQKFNEAQFATPDALCLALATSLALQLDLDISPESVWKPHYGANLNLEQFVRRRVLLQMSEPLVWGLDELDRVFTSPFSGEIFSLFRSWHNERSLDPDCPWSNLTLAMAYATEAHLFIRDVNHSPFNVGTLFTLDDFTPAQVADLNQRHGGLLSETELVRFYHLVGGQPYLVRHGLNSLALQPRAFSEFEGTALAESGIYGEHLRRMFRVLSRSSELMEVIRALLASRALPTQEQFYRLRTAGILSGASASHARFRCSLYADYFAQHLTPNA